MNMDLNKLNFTRGFISNDILIRPRTSIDVDSVEFNDLEESIRKNGILNPIFVCRYFGGPSSLMGMEGHIWAWELLAGRRRVIIARRLGIPSIPALVIDTRLTEEEKAQLKLQIDIVQSDYVVTLKTEDIWKAIELIYLEFGDPKICAEKTGIPLKLVKEVINKEVNSRS